MKREHFFEKMHLLPLLLFLLLLSFASCTSDEVDPLTGDLLIELGRGDLEGVGYNIFSEAYLLSETYFPPVASGTINGSTLKVKGLNHGNYIMEFQAGTNWRVFLQVTAGQERKFVVD